MRYFLILFIFILASCEPVVSMRGNAPKEPLLAQITVGEQNKEDVFRLLGSPSSQTMFEEETWLYISSVQKQNAFLRHDEEEREIVAITFDTEGKVKDIRRISKEDGLEIDVSSDETPTSGHSFGVLEQLFGNVGRFEKSK